MFRFAESGSLIRTDRSTFDRDPGVPVSTVESSDSPEGANVSQEIRRIAVSVTKDSLRQIRGGHPWVYDGSITRLKPPAGVDPADLEPGDLAVIFDDKGRFAAVGLFDPDSPIRVRVLHVGTPRNVDDEFFAERVATAAAVRLDHFDDSDTNGFRLVHGENDGLPGLIVDRYADTAVIKLYSAAWFPHLGSVMASLRRALATAVPSAPGSKDLRAIVLRLSRSLGEPGAGVDTGDGDGATIWGEAPSGPVAFKENGLRFEADVVHGHKTGFFLDQRDNRRLIRSLANGKDVLDVFSFSGGFSVSAAAGGARSVHSVDISPWALEAAARNVELNRRIGNVRRCRFSSTVGDARRVLDDLAGHRRNVDLVVVDPPSFASNARQVSSAIRAYSDLAGQACALVRPGGTLFQASCSARIDRIQLQQAVIEGAHRAGYSLVDVREYGQPIDHPIGFAQGGYLKAITATVLRNR